MRLFVMMQQSKADKEYEELTREERYELGAAEEVLFVCIDMGAEAVKASIIRT